VGRPVPPRDYARRCGEQAIGLLARALNHLDNPDLPYRYADRHQAAFRRLAAEFVDIVESGEIVTRDGALAQDDADFQRFMQGVLEQRAGQ
jgi:hypothetical protein